MSRLWLVRHGPTHATGMVGWTDLPADLSDTAAIARLEAALPPAPVVSSDLARARRTADALCGTRPRRPDDPRWREIHFGAWEGQTYDRLTAAETAAFWSGAARAPGGEGWHDLSARVGAALADLPGEAIVVAHFGAILAAVQRLAGLTLDQTLSHRIAPLSLTEVDRATGTILRINHIP